MYFKFFTVGALLLSTNELLIITVLAVPTEFLDKKAIKLGKEINDDYNYVASVTVLSECYFYLDSLSKAKELVFNVFNYFSDPIHEPSRLMCYNLLQNIYAKEKNYKDSAPDP